MSFSNDHVFTSYLGNGVDDHFSITFDFMPGEYNVILCALYDITDADNPIRLSDPVLDGAGTYDYTLDITTPVVGSPEETAVAITNTPIPANHRLYYFRSTGDTSPVTYNDLRFPYVTVETDFDRLYQMSQENRKALLNADLFESFIPPYEPGSSFRAMVEEIMVDILGTTKAPIPTGAGTTLAAEQNRYIFTSALATTLTLPATHTAGKTISFVEASGTASTKVIDGNGSTIIGIGATYTLQSEYESKTLLSDGTNWYFI